MRDESLYANVTIPLPKLANEEAFRRLPESVQKSEGRKRWGWRFDTPEKAQSILRDYYRLITGELIVKPLRILTRFRPRAGAAACGRPGGVEIRQSFRIPTVNTAPNLQIDSAIPSDFVRGMNSATAA